jgi:hypothetical protein
MDKSTTPTRHQFQADVSCDGLGSVQLRDESVPYACPLCAAQPPLKSPARGTVTGRFTSSHPYFTEVAR